MEKRAIGSKNIVGPDFNPVRLNRKIKRAVGSIYFYIFIKMNRSDGTLF